MKSKNILFVSILIIGIIIGTIIFTRSQFSLDPESINKPTLSFQWGNKLITYSDVFQVTFPLPKCEVNNCGSTQILINGNVFRDYNFLKCKTNEEIKIADSSKINSFEIDGRSLDPNLIGTNPKIETNGCYPSVINPKSLLLSQWVECKYDVDCNRRSAFNLIRGSFSGVCQADFTCDYSQRLINYTDVVKTSRNEVLVTSQPPKKDLIFLIPIISVLLGGLLFALYSDRKGNKR